PQIREIKLFFRWLARSSKGSLETKMRTTSLINKWSDLTRALKLNNNHRFSAPENKEMVEV
ncbi:hypothetical protein GQ43DRAFT_375124, partial [Delitschia confertaspora ATCC 74209]